MPKICRFLGCKKQIVVDLKCGAERPDIVINSKSGNFKIRRVIKNFVNAFE